VPKEACLKRASVGAVVGGDLLHAWTSGELTPLERRTIIAKMVDRIVLFPSTQKPAPDAGVPVSRARQQQVKAGAPPTGGAPAIGNC
jgi:hypothetical protein